MKSDVHPVILSIFLFFLTAGGFLVGRTALSYATFQSAETFSGVWQLHERKNFIEPYIISIFAVNVFDFVRASFC